MQVFFLKEVGHLKVEEIFFICETEMDLEPVKLN